MIKQYYILTVGPGQFIKTFSPPKVTPHTHLAMKFPSAELATAATPGFRAPSHVVEVTETVTHRVVE